MSTRTTQTTVQRGNVIPDFTLPDSSGERISSRSFYLRRNLVIVFLPDRLSEEWPTWTTQLVESMMSVPVSDAQVFLIAPNSNVVAAIEERTAPAANISMLVDSDGRIAGRFGYDGDSGLLLVTDRFGVVFHLVTGDPDSDEMAPDAIPGWVEFIACQCS